MKAKKKQTIPNWGTFDVQAVGVTLQVDNYYDEDVEPVDFHYSAFYTMFIDTLDDDCYDEDSEDQLVINIATEFSGNDAEQIALLAAKAASVIWHEVHSNIPIFCNDELIRELDLEDLLSDKSSHVYVN